MKNSLIHAVAALSCAAVLCSGTSARAETTATVTTTSGHVASDPVARESHESVYMPNRYLLASGLIIFGIPYTASVVVAAESGSSDADKKLFLPIVGPWLDIGQRQGCPVGNNSCNGETGNKVLLGVDGVFQAVGTLQFVWAFLRPEHDEITTISATKYTPKIALNAARVASGYGMTAFVEF